MKFLADESCAGPVIRALRDAGHDVTAIAEVVATVNAFLTVGFSDIPKAV